MISYSVEGGGIGAHVDNYDVFLLQGRLSLKIIDSLPLVVAGNGQSKIVL